MSSRAAEKAEVLSLLAARAPMSPAERDEQMRDAVYGNVGLEYPQVTRAMVDRVFATSAPSRPRTTRGLPGQSTPRY